MNKSKRVYILIGIGVFLFIILTPFILNIILIGFPQIKTAENLTDSDWIPFWGSYLGGVIGGTATLLTLIVTINHFNKQFGSLEDQAKNSKEEFEKKYELLQQQVNNEKDYYNNQINVLRSQHKEVIEKYEKQLLYYQEKQRMDFYPVLDISFVKDENLLLVQNVGDITCSEIKLKFEDFEVPIGQLAPNQAIKVADRTYDTKKWHNSEKLIVTVRDLKNNTYLREYKKETIHCSIGKMGFENKYVFILVSERLLKSDVTKSCQLV